MGPNKTILVVCRNVDDIYLLSRLRIQSKYRYILASDDIRVHKEVKKYPWVSDVSWIEQMESFYCVADDVIKFLDVINQWLESLGDDERGIPKELLFWIRHCEGGMTTQRIQDALLLIRSYLHLFDTYHIDSVTVLCHPGTHWEDEVLIETARSRNIEVKAIGQLRASIFTRRILNFLKIFARDPYYINNFLRSKFRSSFRFKQTDTFEKEIVFQLCSSSYKHSENIIPIMKALKDKKYNPVALCWLAPGGADRVRREGLRVEELEKMVPISSIWMAPYLVYQIWKKAKSRHKQFLMHPKLKYQSIPVGLLLWPSVKYFFMGELPHRYRLFLATKKYFDCHFPLAIKLWGGGTLVEGDLVVKCLKEKKNRPKLFYYFWVFFDSPYESKTEYIDLFLGAGNSHKKYLERLGVSSDKIALVGMSRYIHILDFRKHHTPEQSLFHLGIPSSYSTYILYDPNVILRGYLAVSEQAQTMEFLLDLIKKHPSTALIIKPHPGHRPGLLESLIDSYSLQNVFLINKNMPPYHALNVANFLITKSSTIGVEAMLLGCPIISVILDNEERFKIYEDAAEYKTTIEELNKLLTKLVNDVSFRFKWTEKQIEKQKSFLQNFLGESTQLSNIFAANAIEEKLNQVIKIKN